MSRIPVILIILITMFSNVQAQQLHQVTFSRGSDFSYFTILVDNYVLIRVSADGKILEWGTEEQSGRNSNYYAPKLQPYMGRVEYYGNDADSVYRGKVKSIGTCNITYYGSFESDSKPGKIRTMGIVFFDYYSNYDNDALKGKLRSAGNLNFDYYNSFENEAYRGKPKSIGATPVTYYSSFDDQAIRGKIKSIGTVSYHWYTSFDRRELRGSLKNGLYRQYISGVTYIVR